MRLPNVHSKPGRYGIKIWILADSSSSYCYNADIYTGKVGNSREIGQPSRVVLELTDLITNSGRNIGGDNFFSSLHLVQSLRARQLTYLGTIRKNKPKLPLEALPNSHRPVESSVFGFLPDCTIVSYVPKRNKGVTLISSNHRSAEISNNAQKPAMIIDYNHRKSGVDTLDQMARAYSCKRRTRRWPMSFFQYDGHCILQFLRDFHQSSSRMELCTKSSTPAVPNSSCTTPNQS